MKENQKELPQKNLESKADKILLPKPAPPSGLHILISSLIQ